MVPCFGLPTCPVPGLKLGLWSLPLAWIPWLPWQHREREADQGGTGLLLRQAGWAVRTPLQSAGGRGWEKLRTLGKASRLPPCLQTPGRKGILGPGISPLYLSPRRTMSCSEDLTSRADCPQEKGMGCAVHAPCTPGTEGLACGLHSTLLRLRSQAQLMAGEGSCLPPCYPPEVHTWIHVQTARGATAAHAQPQVSTAGACSTFGPNRKGL